MDLYELENKLKRLRILGAEDHTPVIVTVESVDGLEFNIEEIENIISRQTAGAQGRKYISIDIINK